MESGQYLGADVAPDIDMTIDPMDEGSYRWTVWFIRLMQSGEAQTLADAKKGAAKDLKALASRFDRDLSTAQREKIQAGGWKWYSR